MQRFKKTKPHRFIVKKGERYADDLMARLRGGRINPTPCNVKKVQKQKSRDSRVREQQRSYRDQSIDATFKRRPA